MDNMNTSIELEQMRTQYSALKERLEMQEIVSEKLMLSVFNSKVKDIRSRSWLSYASGAFVMIVAPFVFHYNPVMNLSWWFVLGTELMMLVCILFTYVWNNDIENPSESSSLLEFAESVKLFRKRTDNWLKYVAGPLVLAWVVWMGTELYFNSEDVEQTIFLICGLLFGGAIGGVVGFLHERRTMKLCDEIIDQINS